MDAKNCQDQQYLQASRGNLKCTVSLYKAEETTWNRFWTSVN